MVKTGIVGLSISLLVGCGSSDHTKSVKTDVITPGVQRTGHILTGTGTGTTPELAKRQALRELSSWFEVKISSRSMLKTDFSETTSGNETSVERTDVWTETIFQSTQNRLTGVRYSEPGTSNGQTVIRATLDLTEFADDLTERIESIATATDRDFSAAGDDPWKRLMAGYRSERKREDARLFARYLDVIGVPAPETTLGVWSDRYETDRRLYSIQTTFRVTADSANGLPNGLVNLVHSGFEPAIRQRVPGWLWNTASTDTLFLDIHLRELSIQPEGPDLKLRGRVEGKGFDKRDVPVFTFTVAGKSAGTSAEEAARQFGQSVARQVAGYLADPVSR